MVNIEIVENPKIIRNRMIRACYPILLAEFRRTKDVDSASNRAFWWLGIHWGIAPDTIKNIIYDENYDRRYKKINMATL